MEHVAIDLGGRESQVCIRDCEGQILLEGKHFTTKLENLLKKRPPSRVIVETSAEAFRVADQALACGHEVRVVPATLVRSLGVGSRGVKNDRRDAQILSEVSCRINLPSVHVPSELSRELKAMCGSRDALVSTRTKLINHVRGWMRTRLRRVKTGGAETFAARVRAHAEQHGTPLPGYIDRTLRVLESLQLEIAAADAEVKRMAKEHEVCRRMMTVPGVGPITAIRFVAALDVCGRFDSAHAVQSYLGLTPGENSSSKRQQRTGITKAGSRLVRHALVQAAWCAIRVRPGDLMVRWSAQLAQRRGKFIAAVALARKMAGILYAIWRDGSTYSSVQGAAKEQLT